MFFGSWENCPNSSSCLDEATAVCEHGKSLLLLKCLMPDDLLANGGLFRDEWVKRVKYCRKQVNSIFSINTCVNLYPTGGLCDFEKDFCIFTQDSSDDLDWIRYKGFTPTPGTGPSVDHTLGSQSGNIMTINKFMV